MQKYKLKVLQDNACPYISAAMENYMQKKNVKVEFIPPILPYLKEVENLFGLMLSRLVDRPMRTFKGVTAEVSRCWKSVTKKDTSEAFAKMKERMREAIEFEGQIIWGRPSEG